MSCVIRHFDEARLKTQRERDKYYRDAGVTVILDASRVLRNSVQLKCGSMEDRQKKFLIERIILLCRERGVKDMFRISGYAADLIVRSYTDFVPFMKSNPSQIVLRATDLHSLREYAETLFIMCLLLPMQCTLPYRLPWMMVACRNAYYALNMRGEQLEVSLKMYRHLTRILPVAKKVLSDIGYQY